ncbi:MAG TPA: S8 family peptidase [Oligoflexia bacterium]|nr:S8 family peptidase [Oligoflexia bacterium]
MLYAVAEKLQKTSRKFRKASRARWVRWAGFQTLLLLSLFLLSNSTEFFKSPSGDRVLASVSQLRNWGLLNHVSDSHIHAVDAWKIEKGSREVVVAVVDTGIDVNHPDLKANLWKDKETGAHGFDFVSNNANPIDTHGHGTHVAGILGAALNAKAGISGVAHNVSIMAVKYYSNDATGAENLRNSVRALNWAIDHGAKIINYSGGGPEASQEEYRALRRAQEKDILLVVAAGNEKKNSDNPEHYYYPCAYQQLTNVICVAATNIKNELLSSSNWGKNRVDVAAPGEKILSTIPGGKYGYMSGTSQATAFVTGLAALILSKNRSLKPQEVREIIRSTVDRASGLIEKIASGGKVNAYRALAEVNRRSGAKRVIAQKTLTPVKVPAPLAVPTVASGTKKSTLEKKLEKTVFQPVWVPGFSESEWSKISK